MHRSQMDLFQEEERKIREISQIDMKEKNEQLRKKNRAMTWMEIK